MNIIRGMFRLSIVVALAAAAFSMLQTYNHFVRDQAVHTAMVLTLKCGARLDRSLLLDAQNEFGNIDLGKLGCSDKQFFASVQEIDDAWNGKLDDYGRTVYRPLNLEDAAMLATIAFVLTNLLGLFALLCQGILRWLVRGFTQSN